jgi:hypothetical protein
MTRLITNTNKVVVPKDYIKCVGEHSYLPLSRVEATTHSVDVSSISPFDFVYEEGYNYMAISENVDIKREPIDPIDITYKIIFNISPPICNFGFVNVTFA